MENFGAIRLARGTLGVMTDTGTTSATSPAEGRQKGSKEASAPAPGGPFFGWPTFVAKPFTYREGRDAGISARTLQSAEFRQIVWGVYVHSRVTVDGLTEARAIKRALPDHAFVSHLTAARLLGAVVPHTSRLHASVPRGHHRSSREHLVVHSSTRDPVDFRGLRVTSAIDTFLDCATLLDLVDLVILGDSLVKKRRTTPEQLLAGCAAARGRGVRRARKAAALVRSGVDSPMETRARLLRVLSGLPELETDIRFYDDQGNLQRRLDAGDRATRTAVEFDGRHHIEREETWEADIGRREEFEDKRWRIVTLTSKDIFTTPGETVKRLRRIFQQRGIPLGRPRDDWRRHFSGRE